MPLYEFLCSCGKITEAYRTVAGRNRAPRCSCGGKTKKQISHYHVTTEFTPYRAVGLPGQPYIKTRAEHKAQLRRHGRDEIGNDRSMQPEMEASDREWHDHQSKRKAKIEAEIAQGQQVLAKLGE